MNKLLVSSKLEVDNNIYDIKVDTKDLIINSNNINKLYLINESLDNIIINLNDQSNLDIYIYNDNNFNTSITINQSSYTILNMYYNFINTSSNNLKIINNINGSNNESLISIKNISYNDLSNIEVIANIKKDSKNNNIVEDVSGITSGGTISVLPDIICDSNEVIANHYTTIGNVSDNELNYLMSKGISSDTSKNLILNGFIHNKMDDYMKEEIKKNGGD